MPQVYATVYDNTSVLVFTKNAHSHFFQGHIPGAAITHGPGKCCFPGGKIAAVDFGGYWPQYPTPAQWTAARIAGARREFLEETGVALPVTHPVTLTINNEIPQNPGAIDNPKHPSCHFFPLPAGVTLAQVQTQIADQLTLANGAGWQHALDNGTLHIEDNELASVAIVPWANLPDASFPAGDNDVDWFRSFVTRMKQHLHIP